MPKEHHIKCTQQFFRDVAAGAKNFDVRILDRDYEVGDTVYQHEIDDAGYTGKKIACLIQYILTHEQFPDGLKPGYGVLGLGSIDVSGAI